MKQSKIGFDKIGGKTSAAVHVILQDLECVKQVFVSNQMEATKTVTSHELQVHFQILNLVLIGVTLKAD